MKSQALLILLGIFCRSEALTNEISSEEVTLGISNLIQRLKTGEVDAPAEQPKAPSIKVSNLDFVTKLTKGTNKQEFHSAKSSTLATAPVEKNDNLQSTEAAASNERNLKSTQWKEPNDSQNYRNLANTPFNLQGQVCDDFDTYGGSDELWDNLINQTDSLDFYKFWGGLTANTTVLDQNYKMVGECDGTILNATTSGVGIPVCGTGTTMLFYLEYSASTPLDVTVAEFSSNLGGIWQGDQLYCSSYDELSECTGDKVFFPDSGPNIGSQICTKYGTRYYMYAHGAGGATVPGTELFTLGLYTVKSFPSFCGSFEDRVPAWVRSPADFTFTDTNIVGGGFEEHRVGSYPDPSDPDYYYPKARFASNNLQVIGLFASVCDVETMGNDIGCYFDSIEFQPAPRTGNKFMLAQNLDAGIIPLFEIQKLPTKDKPVLRFWMGGEVYPGDKLNVEISFQLPPGLTIPISQYGVGYTYNARCDPYQMVEVDFSVLFVLKQTEFTESDWKLFFAQVKGIQFTYTSVVPRDGRPNALWFDDFEFTGPPLGSNYTELIEPIEIQNVDLDTFQDTEWSNPELLAGLRLGLRILTGVSLFFAFSIVILFCLTPSPAELQRTQPMFDKDTEKQVVASKEGGESEEVQTTPNNGEPKSEKSKTSDLLLFRVIKIWSVLSVLIAVYTYFDVYSYYQATLELFIAQGDIALEVSAQPRNFVLGGENLLTPYLIQTFFPFDRNVIETAFTVPNQESRTCKFAANNYTASNYSLDLGCITLPEFLDRLDEYPQVVTANFLVHPSQEHIVNVLYGSLGVGIFGAVVSFLQLVIPTKRSWCIRPFQSLWFQFLILLVSTGLTATVAYLAFQNPVQLEFDGVLQTLRLDDVIQGGSEIQSHITAVDFKPNVVEYGADGSAYLSLQYDSSMCYKDNKEFNKAMVEMAVFQTQRRNQIMCDLDTLNFDYDNRCIKMECKEDPVLITKGEWYSSWGIFIQDTVLEALLADSSITLVELIALIASVRYRNV